MLLGYSISYPDNESYMLRGPSPHPKCEECGFVLDHEWIDPQFRLIQPYADLSATYDGYTIATERFCDFASKHGGRCIELPSAPGFSSFRVDERIAFDSVRRKTRFAKRCSICGQFGDVTGSTPIFIQGDQSIPDRFVGTDVEFGSGDEKHPIILVGVGLAEELRKTHKSIDLRPVPNPLAPL